MPKKIPCAPAGSVFDIAIKTKNGAKAPHRRTQASDYYTQSKNSEKRATIFVPTDNEIAHKSTVYITAREIVNLDLSRREFGKLMSSVLFDKAFDFVYRGTRTPFQLIDPEPTGNARRASWNDDDAPKDRLEREFGPDYRWLTDFYARALLPPDEWPQNLTYKCYDRVRLIIMTLSVVVPDRIREAFVIHPWE